MIQTSNSANLNRRMVTLGKCHPTSGMKKTDTDVTRNKAVYFEDRWPTLWPCDQGHPPEVIKRYGNVLRCMYCETDRKRVKAGKLPLHTMVPEKV